MSVYIYPAQYIRIDVFPASVTVVDDDENYFPGREYRIIATDNRLYVLTDDVDGPCDLLNEELVEFSGGPKEGWTAKTVYNTYHIKREDNCGCGSRLRGYHPFLGVPYAARMGL